MATYRRVAFTMLVPLLLLSALSVLAEDYPQRVNRQEDAAIGQGGRRGAVRRDEDRIDSARPQGGQPGFQPQQAQAAKGNQGFQQNPPGTQQRNQNQGRSSYNNPINNVKNAFQGMNRAGFQQVNQGQGQAQQFRAPGQAQTPAAPSQRRSTPIKISESPECASDVKTLCSKSSLNNNFAVLDCLQNDVKVFFLCKFHYLELIIVMIVGSCSRATDNRN